MNKKSLFIIIAVVAVLLAVYAFGVNKKFEPQTPVFDPLNATYAIEGQPVTLVNGKGTSTTVFGSPTMGDINGDGKPDAAVMLVQNPGGSGTFYYVAAAIWTSEGAEGTNAVLLGDRIAPQTMQIQNGHIIANYADRKPTDSMTTPPSVGITKDFIYNGSVLELAPTVAGPGERCGGNMTTAPTCGTGYHCAPEPGSHLPFGDVGGVCVKD